ncbi:phosphatase domain-containing protein [Congregibacter litoralis]|nr:protein-tyrosine phosphatase family protein [Congregibacter litoralis]
MTGAWARDLDQDLQAICDWGACGLITLMETDELVSLGVPDLGGRSNAHSLSWWHMPIVDVSIPTKEFEMIWHESWWQMVNLLSAEENLVIHCRGGLGRTGLVAARILVDLGLSPDVAIKRVRSARPGAIETTEQKRYVLDKVWDRFTTIAHD